MEEMRCITVTGFKRTVYIDAEGASYTVSFLSEEEYSVFIKQLDYMNVNRVSVYDEYGRVLVRLVKVWG